MGVDRPIDVTADQRKTLLALIKRHLPNTTAWAYGSRVKWTARPQSDLDLVVFTKPEQEHNVSELREAFEESNLPFRVDLFVWDTVPDQFRKQIEIEHAVLVEIPERNFLNSKWSMVTVEAISERVAMGPFGSSIKVETFVPEGIPIISGQHLHGARVDDGPGFNFITEDHAHRLANANVERGDIVFTHRGNIGQAAYVPKNSQFERYVISQSQFYMRCDSSKAIPEFITAYFRSLEGQHKLLANASQVGVPSIAQPVTYLRTIEIPLPPLPEQRAIAHILGTLDDKIELNRRMNETLEAMARALFKSWFIDFDPVRAKAVLRNQGGSDWAVERARVYLDNMDEEIAALFPDRLVDSELGPIPEGWKVSTIGQEVDVVGGSTPSTKDAAFWNGTINWATPKDLSSLESPVLVETSRKITEKGLDKISSGLLPRGTVLLSSRAPIGYLAISDVPVAINQGFIAMKCQKRLSNTYAWLWTAANMAAILENANGSTFQEISKSNFRPLRMIVPHVSVRKTYDKLMQRLYDRIVKNERQSHSLADLRDILLPKLISGELRVNRHKGHLTNNEVQEFSV